MRIETLVGLRAAADAARSLRGGAPVAALIEAAVAIEGAVLPLPPSPPSDSSPLPSRPRSEARPLTSAERTARWRASRETSRRPSHGDARDVTCDGDGDVTCDVTVTSRGDVTSLSRSPSSLSLSQKKEREISSLSRSGDARDARDGDGVTVTVTSPRDVTCDGDGDVTRHTYDGPPPVVPTNAAADGAGGLMVSAWAQGIGSVTGALYPEPRGRVAGSVGQALRAEVSTTDGAYALGAGWARANAGRQLNALDFATWLGSGRPDRTRAPWQASGPLTSEGLDPSSAAASDARKRRAEAERQERMAEALAALDRLPPAMPTEDDHGGA